MDLIKILKDSIDNAGLTQVAVAEEAGLTQQSLSNLLSKRSDAKIGSLLRYIDAADRLSPGFESNFWLRVSGPPDMCVYVESLSTTELSLLLSLVSRRIGNYQVVKKQKGAA